MPTPGERRWKPPLVAEQAIVNIVQQLSECAPLTPEFRLLLDCSLVVPQSEGLSYSAGIAASCSQTGAGAVDWGSFLRLVDRHHIPSLVCATLSRCAWEYVPERIRARLKVRDRASRMQAFEYAAQLVHIGKLFSQRGIELLPCKGPLLSEGLYGNPCMRHSRDLDIMVRPEGLDRADRALHEEGYERTFPGFNLSPKQKKVFQSAIQHYNYRHPQRSAQVELHWKIDLWAAEQVVELWKHSRFIEWSGVPFRRLDEEMLLLLLCDHGSRHQWFRIKWLSDVACLFSQHSMINWTRLIDMASGLDLRRSLAQGALLVRLLYNVALEEPLRALIAEEGKVIRMTLESLRAMSMSAEEFGSPSLYEKCKKQLYGLRMRTRLPYRYFLQRLFIDAEVWKLLPIHDRLFWLYYLLRLPYWVRRHLNSRSSS